jgi:hypothetical protein
MNAGRRAPFSPIYRLIRHFCPPPDSIDARVFAIYTAVNGIYAAVIGNYESVFTMNGAVVGMSWRVVGVDRGVVAIGGMPPNGTFGI